MNGEPIFVDTKRTYYSTSSSIQPLQVQEYFPLDLSIPQQIFNHSLFTPPPRRNSAKYESQSGKNLEKLLESLIGDFTAQKPSLQAALKARGIPEECAFALYCNAFIHQSKHYPPRGVKESATFENLIEYFQKLQYAHCSHKPLALQLLLEAFKIPSRRISYCDIRGWAHGFLQVFIKQQWRILDPTYNLYFDIGIENIIENPYCHRKVLHLYSDEFYTDSTQKHENFICTQIDANTRTTHKYNKEWFSFMGFYPFVPPIWYFHEHFSKETITLYDIRNDSRYILM